MKAITEIVILTMAEITVLALIAGGIVTQSTFIYRPEAVERAAETIEIPIDHSHEPYEQLTFNHE